jgi:hypothetical protein
MNTFNFWLQIVAASGFVIGMLWGVIRFGHNILARSVSDRLEEIRKETKPNGGSSLRDAVDRIERKLDSVASELDEHIGFHKGMGDRL